MRRKSLWVRRIVTGHTIDLIGPVLTQHPGYTVDRIRGQIAGNVLTSTNTPYVAGILVRAATGTVPGPVSDPTADWMMYHPWLVDVAGFAQNTTFDCRAARRMDELSMTCIFRNQTYGGVDTSVDLAISVLLLAP
jgi:hypothetical protein